MGYLLCLTSEGLVVQDGSRWLRGPDLGWDEVFNHERLSELVAESVSRGRVLETEPELFAPIGSQEVWAAGVTYFRSRTARMEESEAAGGGDFYDRVYYADRPELFFKATAHRVVAPGQPMLLRSDSKWIVPEPELVLAINARGELFGYAVGNDLSCRDIEGENPLYLPQAKIFDRCAAIGPGVWISDAPPPPETKIELSIERGGKVISQDSTELSQMKKKLPDLVRYLQRHNSFPSGCYLFTGTGIIPASDFSLADGDRVTIRIEPIGSLVNPMSQE